MPHVTVLVNKMDLVGYAEERFDASCARCSSWPRGSACTTSSFIPVSALHGDNVVDRSEAMPWYAGQPLLEHLERCRPSRRPSDGPARLPVQ